MKTIVSLLCMTALVLSAQAQQNGTYQEEHEPELTFEAYQPKSTLVVPAQTVVRARYPFVDVHNHQWAAPQMTQGRLDTMLMEMDQLNMAVMVNLSGRSGAQLQAAVENMEGYAPTRFVTFANVSFENIDDPEWTAITVQGLEEAVRNGARGLKIYKNLGLTATDSQGHRIAVDDPRIDPVWAKCGELGIPVLIHSGEPSSFWSDRNRYNERWLELKQFPNRYRSPNDYPSWEQIIGEQHNVFRKHPGTNFINAHLGWLGNDLGRLGRLLDEMPNVYTEVGAVLAELGRQPRFAREFLTQHKERVLFGKDTWVPSEYHYYFRAFETDDEYFDYYRRRHAHWKIYGLDLPDDVLRHIYYKNALRIIPGLDPSLFPED